MQLYSLDDLYQKCRVIKVLRVGNTDKPKYAFSDGLTSPSSEGDILYEKSKFGVMDEGNESPMKENENGEENGVKPEIQDLSSAMNSNGEARLDSSVASHDSSILKRTDSLTEKRSKSAALLDENYIGPLSQCLLADDDLLTEEDHYKPNDTTARIKVFLPNKYPIYVIVKQQAKVQDAIEKAIWKANALRARYEKKLKELSEAGEGENAKEIEEAVTSSELSPKKEAILKSFTKEERMGMKSMSLLTDSMAYELRMELEAGECDMDFPALERGGILVNFVEDDSQGFCLVSVPDYQPRSVTPIGTSDTIEVSLVFYDEQFTYMVPSTSTCKQLLNQARHRLYPGRVYELTVSNEDKERLKMMSDVVNENTRLCDIDTTTFRIRLKRFFDGPKVIACPTYSYNTDSVVDTGGIDLTTYMFTNFEAGKYKEWPVTKVSRKGKKQKRIFAIDRDEIFVLRPSSFINCRSCNSSDNIYIFISDIVDISPRHNPPDSFILKYKDEDMDMEDEEWEGRGDDGNMTLVFETISMADCCEIVNRIEHLMRNAH